MADERKIQSAILCQNTEKTVSLLDLPVSITLAQGTLELPCTNQIYSSSPLQESYPSTEPKSERARTNVLQTKGDTDLDFPETLLRQALVDVTQRIRGDWCLQRKISPFALDRQSKVPLS